MLAGKDITCDYTGPNCVDSGTRTASTEDCTFSRKLCVRCEGDGNNARIKVQSNGLPRHCFYGAKPLVEQNIDFEVLWNPTA